MEYNYLDNTLLIEGSKGYVYQNNKLMFQGNSYFAIVLYIKNTDYNAVSYTHLRAHET